MNRNTNVGILILRVAIGISMLMHGIAKLKNGTGFIESSFDKAGLPPALAYTVYITEVLAPLMLVVGFRSRIAALLVAGTMLVVMLVVLPAKLSQTIETGAWALELQGLFLFGSLALFFTGAGKYAVSTKSKWD